MTGNADLADGGNVKLLQPTRRSRVYRYVLRHPLLAHVWLTLFSLVTGTVLVLTTMPAARWGAQFTVGLAGTVVLNFVFWMKRV